MLVRFIVCTIVENQAANSLTVCRKHHSLAGSSALLVNEYFEFKN